MGEKGEERRERICRTCQKGIEDEEHFILKCEGYTEIRNKYKGKIEKIIEKTNKVKKKENNKEEKAERVTQKRTNEWLEILLGKRHNMEIIEIAIEYLKRITSERDRLQGKNIFKKLKKREIYL